MTPLWVAVLFSHTLVSAWYSQHPGTPSSFSAVGVAEFKRIICMAESIWWFWWFSGNTGSALGPSERARKRCPQAVGLWGQLSTRLDVGRLETVKYWGRALAVWAWITPNSYLLTRAAILKEPAEHCLLFPACK